MSGIRSATRYVVAQGVRSWGNPTASLRQHGFLCRRRRFPEACNLKPVALNPTAIFTYMRLQIDRFEDGGWVVVLAYPNGRKSFDVPKEFFPGEASVGDVFDVRVEHDREETGRLAEENRRLLDGFAGGGR